MHGFGTPVKRPPDSITPRFRRPIRNNIHPSKNTSLITKKSPRDNAFQHRLPAFNAFLRTPRAFPLPISHNNLLPERHAHVAVDEHVRLHVLADGLRRGGGKLREDFVGIAL